MNPIELGKAIAEVGIPIITAVMLILLVGLVWYLIKRQTKREDKHDTIQREERIFYRNLVTNDMKELHQDSVKNAELNTQGIVLQKEMIKDFKSHNGHAKEFSKKIIESIERICDKLSIIKDRRKKVKKVELERRQ